LFHRHKIIRYTGTATAYTNLDPASGNGPKCSSRRQRAAKLRRGLHRFA